MHHIYHTEGLILGSRDFGESGRYYYVFTRELGMITASAQGVRKMSSKLRFVLQDFSCAKVDLVRGKDFWRITSASKSERLEDLPKIGVPLAVISNVSRLLRRLLPGEEANEALYDDLTAGLGALVGIKDEREVRSLEALIVLRTLSHLGYIGGSERTSSLISSPFGTDLLFEVSRSRPEILREINKALKETHL